MHACIYNACIEICLHTKLWWTGVGHVQLGDRFAVDCIPSGCLDHCIGSDCAGPCLDIGCGPVPVRRHVPSPPFCVEGSQDKQRYHSAIRSQAVMAEKVDDVPVTDRGLAEVLTSPNKSSASLPVRWPPLSWVSGL